VFFPVLLGLSLAALWLGTSWREPGTWRRLGLAHPSIVLLAVAIGWAGCTSFWAVEPDISFRRFFLQVFISASLVGAILAARKPERVMHATFWTMVPVAALNAVAVVTEPPGPIGHEGIYPHKNYFGGVAVVLMMFAVWRLGAGPGIGRVAAIALAVLSVWFIVVSESKTSLALIVVAPTAALGLALVQRWLSISPLIAFTAALVIATFVYAFGVAALLWDFESAAERIFGDPTLTQRTDIWAFALKKIPERPWLGFGYEVFWGAGLDSPSLREGPGFVAKMPHAHNGYIDAVLQTGIVGLITLVAVIGAALATAGRVARRDLSLGLFVLSVFVMSVLYNGLETTWLRSFNMIWMLFVFALALSVSIVSEPPGGTRRSP
jgi:O-antigen ligase